MLLNNLNKKTTIKFESFFLTCCSIINTGFSVSTNYLAFKKNQKRLLFLTKQKQLPKMKRINLKFKMGRFDIKNNNNYSYLPGFYRSL
jgi:hypothetical protein